VQDEKHQTKGGGGKKDAPTARIKSPLALDFAGVKASARLDQSGGGYPKKYAKRTLGGREKGVEGKGGSQIDISSLHGRWKGRRGG